MRGDIELRVLPNDALMTCGLTRRRRSELGKAREALLQLEVSPMVDVQPRKCRSPTRGIFSFTRA